MSKKVTREDFILRVRQRHGDIYDYSKSVYLYAAQKIVVICKKHGDFKVTPHKHLIGTGCPTCGRESTASKLRKTTEIFIERALARHGDTYNYSKVKYFDGRTPVTIVCPRHGRFKQIPYVHFSGCGCPQCGKEKASDGIRKDVDSFIQESKQVHGDRYGYDKVVYVNSNTPVIIVCPEHGDFQQKPVNHINGQGCQACGRLKANQSHSSRAGAKFVSRAIKIHDDRYNYDKVIYIKANQKVIIVCLEHGEFKQLPNTHLQGHGCPKCANDFTAGKLRLAQGDVERKFPGELVSGQTYRTNRQMLEWRCPAGLEHPDYEQTYHTREHGVGCPQCSESDGEKRISAYLKSNNIIFEREKRFLSCKHILVLPFDFSLPEHQILIEFQGRQHYHPVSWFGGKKTLKNYKKRDRIKRYWARKNGWHLICVPYTIKNISKYLDKRLGQSKPS